jgi:hypothetical protein
MHDRGEIISEEERLGFINWICSEYGNMTVHRPGLIGRTFVKEDKAVPEIVWTVLNRILDRENLHEYKDSYNDEYFKKLHNGRTGVYRDHVAIVLPGANINPHYDFNEPDKIHARFNVYFQVPTEGGETYYSGDFAPVKERHYLFCRSGIDKHWTKIVKGTQPRISISYGFQLPRKKVDELYAVQLDKKAWNLYNFQVYLFNLANYILGFPQGTFDLQPA